MFRLCFVLSVLGLISMASVMADENTALCFGGVDGCLELGCIESYNESATVEFRFLWDGPPPPPVDYNQAIIFCTGSSGEMSIDYYEDNGEPIINFGVKTTDGSFHHIDEQINGMPWCDGQIHHFAAVYDYTQHALFVYIDGELIAEGSVPDNPLYRPSWLHTAFCRYGTPRGNFAWGMYSELRFWDKAVPPEDLQLNMWGSLTGAEEDLIGYWKMDEGEGDVVNDYSPAGNAGSILGGVEWCAYEAHSAVSPGSWGSFKMLYR